MTAGDINLLKAKTTLSAQQIAILDNLRQIGIILIAIALLGGVVTGSLYWFVSTQLTAAEAKKSQLLRNIASEAQKEALYVSLKNRLPIVQKAFDDYEPWGDIVGLIPTIATPPALKSVAVDDKNMTQMTVEENSIEETAVVINQVIALVRSRKIYNPQLVGLQITDDGSVQMTLSFLPLF